MKTRYNSVETGGDVSRRHWFPWRRRRSSRRRRRRPVEADAAPGDEELVVGRRHFDVVDEEQTLCGPVTPVCTSIYRVFHFVLFFGFACCLFFVIFYFLFFFWKPRFLFGFYGWLCSLTRTEFDLVDLMLPRFTEFYWVLLGFTGFYRVFIGFYRVFLACTGFYERKLGFFIS